MLPVANGFGRIPAWNLRQRNTAAGIPSPAYSVGLLGTNEFLQARSRELRLSEVRYAAFQDVLLQNRSSSLFPNQRIVNVDAVLPNLDIPTQAQ